MNKTGEKIWKFDAWPRILLIIIFSFLSFALIFFFFLVKHKGSYGHWHDESYTMCHDWYKV